MARRTKEPTDREARALIVAAEAVGFRREPHLLFWQYDESLHDDADGARTYLEANRPDLVSSCRSAPDPIPARVAVERISNERGGIDDAQVTKLIQAALDHGFDLPETELPLLEPVASRERACRAIALLWDHHPQVIPQVLGDRGRIAPLPETAVMRCPSCCDDGWVPHPYAGRPEGEAPAAA